MLKKNVFGKMAASLGIAGLVLSGLLVATQVSADVDPANCTATGGGISLDVFRADGTTPIGAAGTATDGELIKYKATLEALSFPKCAFEGGTWTLTTPDGVSHPLGAVPRIGGTGVASITSGLISYTVIHGDEIVNSTRHLNATTSYSGGQSHADALDETAGPSLGTSIITKIVHTPTVTTDIHNANHEIITSVPGGSTVHDSATITGEVGGPVPTGTVDFTFFTNSSCEGLGTASGTAVPLVAGVADPSTSQGPLAPGSYGFKAHYNGNGNYTVADGQCEPLTVDKYNSTTVTEIHNVGVNHTTGVTSVPTGSSVDDEATVSGSGPAATGNVTFTFFTGGGCDTQVQAAAGVVALSGGVAHPSTVEGPLGVGSYAFRASYGGDVNYNSSVGPCEPLTVTIASPTIATVPSAGGNIGTVLNDTATLSGGSSPTGSVTFTLYAPSDATCVAAPVYTDVDAVAPYATTGGYASLVAGVYHWKAAYAGDANNSAVTSPCSEEAVTITQPTGQWCSHGYWKQSQHFDSWSGYAPGQLFSSVFENAFPGKTLLQVLQQGGGGLNALGRDTVGELLNTAAGLTTGFTTGQIVTNFNNVFPGSKSAYDTLHGTFVAPENCPLN